MKIRNVLTGLAVLTALASAFAGEPKDQEQFRIYKKSLLKDPSLIRLYTFEEGHGEEVANNVNLGKSQTALTGGPLGSLTIKRYTPYGRDPVFQWNYSPDTVSPDWTSGRWPWKSAIDSGMPGKDVEFCWDATFLYRSGISGAEFTEGGTLACWIRIREDMGQGVCNILSMFNGRVPRPKHSAGFNLSYSEKHLTFEISSNDPKVRSAVLYMDPGAVGVWHHVVATFDQTAVKFYLDGELKAEQPFAGSMVPITYKDYPLLDPFHEMAPLHHLSCFMLIGFNQPEEGKVLSRFAIDELAIYKRALTASEVKAMEEAGRPAMSPEEQLATHRAVLSKEQQIDRILLDIPKETGGYFRINEPVVATVEIPGDAGLAGDYKVVFELESLYGKPVQKVERALSVGKRLTESFTLPSCGVYYLDMAVYASDGTLVKRLPQRYCLGMVPPAPKELTKYNPVACYANETELFHFDSPIRRMFCSRPGKKGEVPSVEDFAGFTDRYRLLEKRIPNFRTYLVFYGYQASVTPIAKAWNEKYFAAVGELLKDKDKVFGIEFSSEPHVTVDSKGYVDALGICHRILRGVRPDLQFFPPGIEGSSVAFLRNILADGAIKYMDGVSLHPYGGDWDVDAPTTFTNQVKELWSKHSEKPPVLYDTESGAAALPRLKNGRPMTVADAIGAGIAGKTTNGVWRAPFFVWMNEETGGAARQCQDILLKLVEGYRMYTVMGGPGDEGGQPGVRGVAVTALAGQVLNTYKDARLLPLAVADNICVLLGDQGGATTAAVFTSGPTPLTANFKVPANAEYRTMDMLGNYGTLKAGADGLLTINGTMEPTYVFGVPTDLQAVVPLKLAVPETLPEDGVLKGEVTIVNQLSVPLTGQLSAPAIPGASVTLSQKEVNLAPGGIANVGIELRAHTLKRRLYELGVELKAPSGALISSAKTFFQSPGVVQAVPQIKSPMKLDGVESEWDGIPEIVCGDVESVVHGKPNIAEIWVPQWRGDDDLSFSLKTAWRKGDAIYFILKVRDNVLQPAPADKVGQAFNYDCLEFFFDSRDYAQQGTVISGGADQGVVVPQVGEKVAPCELWYAKNGENHINLECVGRKTEDGYLIEGKVTPNEKSTFRVQAGSQFRMDFLVDDTDKLDPKWLRQSTMALHGQFSNFINSDIWGRYELFLDAK